MLGEVGKGNYGTTAAQLDTSGTSPYSEGGVSGPPSQWQVNVDSNGTDLATFIALSNPQGK